MMTLEHEFERIQELGPAHLILAARFSWAVVQDVTRLSSDGEGHPLMGHGTNPYAAIHAHFALLTQDRVVIYTRYPKPRLVRWNDGRWIFVPASEHFVAEKRDDGTGS